MSWDRWQRGSPRPLPSLRWRRRIRWRDPIASDDPALAGGFWLDLLERAVQQDPDRVFIARRLHRGEYDTFTRRQWFDLVLRYAAWMQEQASPGQVIPLCMGRGPHLAAAMLAALISGRAFSCIDPRLRLPQLELVLHQLGSPVLLADGRGLLVLRGDPGRDSPVHAANWFIVGDKPLSGAALTVAAALRTTTRVTTLGPEGPRAAASLDALRALTPDAERAACCLFTSGSTGTAKGVLISDLDLRRRALTEAAWFALSERDVVLNVLPFSFDIGLNQLLSAVVTGAQLVVLESHMPRDVLDTVAERAVTSVAAVPAIWINVLLNGLRFEIPGAHASLRMLTISGGDLARGHHEQLPAMAPGVAIYKTYGQTEAFRVAALHPDDYAARPMSVGRALPGCRLLVLRTDGTEASAGETGEVVHVGTGTMLGYLGGTGDGAKLRPARHAGAGAICPALHTGDFGVLDEDGFLTLRGRHDDLAKIDGNRVYPGEVAAMLASLAGVATAEVIVFNADSRSALAAFVVPNHGERLDANDIRRQLHERAPGYMVPEQIHVLTDMPTTVSGKPDRVRLRHCAETDRDAPAGGEPAQARQPDRA